MEYDIDISCLRYSRYLNGKMRCLWQQAGDESTPERKTIEDMKGNSRSGEKYKGPMQFFFFLQSSCFLENLIVCDISFSNSAAQSD